MGTTIVTGAGAGLGEAIAYKLASEGRHILVTDMDLGRAETVVEKIRADGGEATAAQLDVSDYDQVQAVLGESLGDLEIDGLVNNAGLTVKAGLLDIKKADIDRMYDVNARGAFYVLQTVVAHMVKRKAGRIVNTSSIAAKGYKGVSNVVYAATKGSIISLTRVASMELAPLNITVNAICPGATRTDMYKELVEAKGEEAIRAYVSLIPMGRVNDVEDISNAVSFLLSDAARNITGQSLNVDGGVVYD